MRIRAMRMRRRNRRQRARAYVLGPRGSSIFSPHTQPRPYIHRPIVSMYIDMYSSPMPDKHIWLTATAKHDLATLARRWSLSDSAAIAQALRLAAERPSDD